MAELETMRHELKAVVRIVWSSRHECDLWNIAVPSLQTCDQTCVYGRVVLKPKQSQQLDG